MKRKPLVAAAIIGTPVLAWLAFGFFGIQAVFYDRTVNEPLPDFISNPDATNTSGTDRIIGRGDFAQGDSTYTIKGKATVSQVNDSPRLSLSEFNVTNGPDLFVYAVQAASTDNQTVKGAVADGGFINLGVLKGNIGNQNYLLDAGYNHHDYPVIAIWCRRFSRNFGSALITP